MAEALQYLKYWKEGGRWDLWVRDLVLVRTFIKEHKLRPVTMEQVLERTHALPTMEVEAPVAKRAARVIPRIGYAGGMRIPHLHFNGDIYALDQKLWGEFTQRTLAGLRERLAQVEQVSFEQLMELSDTVNAVA